MRIALLFRILRVVHIYAAIVLVGSIIFNTGILMPALRRIPPAHSAVVGQKIGSGLMSLGGSAIFLLGVTGFTRAWILGEIPALLSSTLPAGAGRTATLPCWSVSPKDR